MSALSDLIQQKKNERNDELMKYAVKADIRSCRWGRPNPWATLGGGLCSRREDEPVQNKRRDSAGGAGTQATGTS